VARDARGNGVAEALLNALVEHCTQKGLRQMIAVIAVVDDKVSNASTSLHSKLDFRLIGNVEGAGFKHGQWVDTVLMQRKLGPGISTNPGCIN